jgi:hypothetical protein
VVEEMVEGRLRAVRAGGPRIALMRPVVGDLAQHGAGGADVRVKGREAKPAEALTAEHSRVEHSAAGRDEHQIARLHVTGHRLMLPAAGGRPSGARRRQAIQPACLTARWAR